MSKQQVSRNRKRLNARAGQCNRDGGEHLNYEETKESLFCYLYDGVDELLSPAEWWTEMEESINFWNEYDETNFPIKDTIHEYLDWIESSAWVSAIIRSREDDLLCAQFNLAPCNSCGVCAQCQHFAEKRQRALDKIGFTFSHNTRSTK